MTPALPTIADQLAIDGYTQPGAAPHTSSDGNNAAIAIQIVGVGNALELGSGSDGVQSLGNAAPGVMVFSGSGNLIGGTNRGVLGFDFDGPLSVFGLAVEPVDFEPLISVRLSVRLDEVTVADLLREPADSFVEFVFDPIKIGSTLVSVGNVWWLTSAGGLMTTILMGIPTWRHLDLLPIVSKPFGNDLEIPEEQRDLSAEEIFGETISAEFLPKGPLAGSPGTNLPRV